MRNSKILYVSTIIGFIAVLLFFLIRGCDKSVGNINNDSSFEEDFDTSPEDTESRSQTGTEIQSQPYAINNRTYEIKYYLPDDDRFNSVTLDTLQDFLDIIRKYSDSLEFNVAFNTSYIRTYEEASQLIVTANNLCDDLQFQIANFIPPLGNQYPKIVHVLVGYDNDAFSIPTVINDPLAIYIPHMYLFDIKVFLHEFFHYQSLDLGLGSIENDHVEGTEIWNEPLETNCWQRNLMSTAFETLHGYLITQKQSDFFNGNQIGIDHTTQKHIYPVGIVASLFEKNCSTLVKDIEYVNYNHSHICDDDFVLNTEIRVNQDMDTLIFFTPTEKKSLMFALEKEAKIITAGTKFSYVDYAKFKYQRIMQKYHNINLYKVGVIQGKADKAINIVSQPGKLNTLFNNYVSTINDPKYSFNEKIFLKGYQQGIK